MIGPGEIAFDIDGVFANTMGLFIDVVHKEYGIDHVRYDHITQYYLEQCLDIDPEIISAVIHRILEGEFDDKLKPIDDASRILAKLGMKAPLLFVTARPNPLIREWIARMLPEVTFPIDVIATGAHEAKGEILRERKKQYFVEDSLETCHHISRQGITPILFVQPWNRLPHPFQEAQNWKDIDALLNLDVL
jgi:5'(3')-deoxyribonucleotidase